MMMLKMSNDAEDDDEKDDFTGVRRRWRLLEDFVEDGQLGCLQRLGFFF